MTPEQVIHGFRYSIGQYPKCENQTFWDWHRSSSHKGDLFHIILALEVSLTHAILQKRNWFDSIRCKQASLKSFFSSISSKWLKTNQKERGLISAPNQKSRNGTNIKQDYIQEQKYVTRLIKIFSNSLMFLSSLYLFDFQVLAVVNCSKFNVTLSCSGLVENRT